MFFIDSSNIISRINRAYIKDEYCVIGIINSITHRSSINTFISRFHVHHRKSRQQRKPVNYAKNVEAKSRRRHDPMFAIHYEGNAKYKCKPRSNRTYPDRHSPSSDVEEEGLSRKSLRCQQPRHPLSPVATALFYNSSPISKRLNFSSAKR